MKIYIDGDGCPVKEEVYALGEKYHFSVVLVTAFDHYSKNYPENIEVVYVDQGQDSADFKIVALCKKGDLCITQDYGLASILLGKGVTVFHQSFQYTPYNIDQLLESRHLGQMIRKAGKHTKGPKKFTKEDKEKFYHLLEDFLQQKTS